jgi:hypothetical protein
MKDFVILSKIGKLSSQLTLKFIVFRRRSLQRGLQSETLIGQHAIRPQEGKDSWN